MLERSVSWKGSPPWRLGGRRGIAPRGEHLEEAEAAGRALAQAHARAEALQTGHQEAADALSQGIDISPPKKDKKLLHELKKLAKKK